MMDYASGNVDLSLGNGATSNQNRVQDDWDLVLRDIFAEGAELRALPRSVAEFPNEATTCFQQGTPHSYFEGGTFDDVVSRGDLTLPPYIGPWQGQNQNQYGHGEFGGVEIHQRPILPSSGRPTIKLSRLKVNAEEVKTHVGYSLHLKAPVRSLNHVDEARYTVGKLLERRGSWPKRSIRYHCLGYLIYPGASHIFPLYVPVELSFTLTNEAIAQRIECVTQRGLLEVALDDNNDWNPILPLFVVDGIDIPNCISWCPVRERNFLPCENTWILSEIIAAATTFGSLMNNSRKRTNSVISTTAHDRVAEERMFRAAEEVALAYKISTYGRDHLQFTNEGRINSALAWDGGGDTSINFQAETETTVFTSANPDLLQPTSDPEVFTHRAEDITTYGAHLQSHVGIPGVDGTDLSHGMYLPRAEMNHDGGEPLRPYFAGQSSFGGQQSHGRHPSRGSPRSRGGQWSRGGHSRNCATSPPGSNDGSVQSHRGQSSHPGQRFRGGHIQSRICLRSEDEMNHEPLQPSLGGQQSLSEQPSRGRRRSRGGQPLGRGGQPSGHGRKPTNEPLPKEKGKRKRAMANTPEPMDDPEDNIDEEQAAMRTLLEEEKEDADAKKEKRPSRNPEGAAGKPHTPAMGIVLTIPSLFLRNLCTEGATVTTQFQPAASGGVTPLVLCKKLVGEAMAIRGYTAKDFGPIKTAWIEKAGAQRIQRMAYRIKSNAGIYVSGKTECGGYGLTPDLKPDELYKLATALLLDENYLYAAGTKNLPGAIIFSALAIWQFAHRILFQVIRTRVHPDRLSGQIPGDLLKDPKLQRGAIIPPMLIVTIASRFYDEISGYVYPYLESLDEGARTALLCTTPPSESAKYAKAKDLQAKSKKAKAKATPQYYPGVMREKHEVRIMQTRDQSLQLHTQWAKAPSLSGEVCTKTEANSATRKQTAHR